MTDKNKTCQYCADRSLTCRAGCAGWQARESEKEERYANRAIHSANYNTYSHQKEMLMRKKKVPLKGYGQ